jgi:uncharacterized protein YbaP (TraB family)
MRKLRPMLRLAWVMLAAPINGAGLAWADAEPVCQGRDLSGDPSIKPDFNAHADELINSDGLLWRIDKPNVAPSYLFGTIHSTNPEAIALAKDAAAYLKGVTAVATELGGVLDDQRKIDMGAALLKAALSPAEDTIVGAFDAENVKRIDTFLRGRGFPEEMAHHLKLWFLAVAASLPACESAVAISGLPEVDQLIAETGRAAGASIVGLETVDEQLKTLSGVTPQAAAAILAAAARLPSLNDDSYVTLLALYKQKRPAWAIAILDALPGLTPQERAAQDEWLRALLAGRNEAMMERAAPLLANGGAFIAVGALHLPGKGGLVERLRKAGYEVTKVW